MTTQIAVRLPDEMVRFLDQSVASGKAPSRAALVAAALEREMRLHGRRLPIELDTRATSGIFGAFVCALVHPGLR